MYLANNVKQPQPLAHSKLRRAYVLSKSALLLENDLFQQLSLFKRRDNLDPFIKMAIADLPLFFSL